MDALQPSGSFKDRGMAHLCESLKASGATTLISSSGGNAGLAVATVGASLGMNVHVIVPETTKAMMQAKIRAKVPAHSKFQCEYLNRFYFYGYTFLIFIP